MSKLYLELERVFHYFDENGDGKISALELRNRLGLVVGDELLLKEAEDAVESLDSDGDGFLGLDDLVRLMESGGGEEKMEDLRKAFGIYDMEGIGFITPKSLKRMLSRLGESNSIDECKVMIKHFDLNGDGVLSFEEFRVMMQ
ncbi:Parvalbumin [Parasponia andersonii]|uniref:Parvalbumin n=1 Tax=Parasponia andersonii TaxID=3476 RepID=A0A2P5DVM2_PARAD|nr:Parvalbumin [Parasponia andersonii]